MGRATDILMAAAPSGSLTFQAETLVQRGAVVSTFGTQEEWVAPVVHFVCPSGFGEANWVDRLDQTIIAWANSGGTQIRCECLDARGRVSDPAQAEFALQPVGSPNHYVADGPIEFAQLYLPDQLLESAATALGVAHGAASVLRTDLVFARDDRLCELLDQYLARASSNEEAPTRLEMQCRALLVVDRLISRHLDPAYRPGVAHARKHQGGLAPWQLRRVMDRMTGDLADEPGLAELAALVRLSPEHFCRAFRRSTGLPPHRWLTERRMEQARALLLDFRLSLTDVAQMVGYEGQSAFGAAFRRATGWTPSAWRRERMT